MAARLTHNATVVAIDNRNVRVAVDSSESCSCGGCGVAFMCRRDGNMLDIRRPESMELHVGDKVVIKAAADIRTRAIVIGFVTPLLIMIAAIALTFRAGAGQDAAAAISLSSVVVYYVMLFALRKHITKQFQWRICQQSGPR